MINCEFGALLDEALRDCIVCGLDSKAAQKRLLTEPDLMFAKAVEIATSMEEFGKNAHTLQSSESRDVNKVTSSQAHGSSRLPHLVWESGSSTTRPRECLDRAPWRTSRHIPDEIPGQEPN